MFRISLLPYPSYVIFCELVLILLFVPVEATRLFWGKKGNLTETPAYISFSLLTSVPCYVLLLEFLLVVIEGILVLLQILFGIAAVVSMARKQDYYKDKRHLISNIRYLRIIEQVKMTEIEAMEAEANNFEELPKALNYLIMISLN
uniref:Odorant receptor n=1 Tax=Syphacia muris TaxID=451379 RepID=A0A0N5AYF0_9BILA